jgi:DNA-binding SARP family transcriptional activator/TolB-like protein/Flp pilus assembly protein TadD
LLALSPGGETSSDESRGGPLIELRVLGPLQVGAADGRDVETLVRRSKRSALLAYLAAAVPRGFHRRDKLLALFWPELDAPHARAALSQALHVLRAALGERAIATRGDEEVGLNGDVVWCDVATFEAALDSGRPAEALALYRGDLLDGFFISGAPEFERWLDGERGRLRQRASEGAWKLAEATAAEGATLQAERWARRAAELMPADEAVTRQLMGFLHGLGDRAAAIRAYEAFAWQLEKEYELEPSAETRALAAAIRQEERHSPPAPSSGPAPAPARGYAGGAAVGQAATDGRSPRDRGAQEAADLDAHALPRGRRLLVGSVATPRRPSARWLVASTFAVLVAVATLSPWLRRPSVGSAVPKALPRLVVLPFQNLGSIDDEYFADGITDEITSRLAEISGLQVISRASAVQYKDHNKTPRQIGEELDVRYVLEGTIRTDRSAEGAGEVRVTPQLIRVADDAHVWAEQYTVRLVPGEIFRVQADIAERVAQALDVTLLEPERRALAARPTESLQAHDYYLRGGDFYQRSFNERDTRAAVEMFERAVTADSGFALAHARLALAHARLYWLFYDRSPQRLAASKKAVNRALEFDPDLPEAHIALGYYHYWGHLAYDRALVAFRTAQRFQPDNAELLEALANVRRRQGALKEAIASFSRGLELDPRSGIFAFNLAQTLWLAGDPAQAEHYFDRAISLTPDFAAAYWNKARLYLNSEGSTQKGRAALEPPTAPRGDRFILYHAALIDVFEGKYDSALDRVDSLAAEAFDNQWRFVPKGELRGQIYDLLSRPDLRRAHYNAARLVAERRVRDQPDEANFRSALGIAYAGLGRRVEAIREARKAVELLPVSKEAWRGLYRLEDLGRVHVMVGQYDAALQALERLVSLPGGRSIPFLKLDPAWNPIRNHPRFRALFAERNP